MMGPRDDGQQSYRSNMGAPSDLMVGWKKGASGLSFASNLNSPSADSEGTEFFDAHEEIPWTPERPQRQSPSVAADRRRQLALWPENSNRSLAGQDRGRAQHFPSGNGSSEPSSVGGTGDASITAGPQEKANVSGLDSPHCLFPSKASMLRLEVQRSIELAKPPVQERANRGNQVTKAPEAMDTRVSEGSGEDEQPTHQDARSSRGDSLEEVEENGEDTSTASGTTITEEGWDSRHGRGLNARGTAAGGDEARKDRDVGKVGAQLSPVAVRMKGSFRRVFKGSYRKCQPQVDSHLKKIVSVGGRRSIGADDSEGHGHGSPVISPDGLTPLEVASDAGCGGSECGRASGLLRHTGSSSATMDGSDGPPEIKVHHHGRGGGKQEAWRSMHLVQCLRCHEGPIWALEFNRHGTRIATGGKDCKVIVWDLAVPPDKSPPARPGAGSEDFGARSVSLSVRDEERGDATSADRSASREGVHTESISSASGHSDDVHSLGRAASDQESEGRQRSFSELEVFATTPARIFTGHTNDVVDLSWSHSDFLCSASIDGTVMLWHPRREERLGVFKHPNFVTSVQFHPSSNKVILTGCFDKRLRLWNTTDERVFDWVQCQDMISAASFSPDGQLTTAGLYDGRVIFYHTKGLRYYTQIHCRNRHGSNRRGKKVTGLAFIETAKLRRGGREGSREGPAGCSSIAIDQGKAAPPHDDLVPAAVQAGLDSRQIGLGKAGSMSAQYSLLSTTNDSRLRIHDLDNYTMTGKFKGFVNEHIQMKATFSQDGAFAISASEDGQVFLWNSQRQWTSNAVGIAAADAKLFEAGGVGASSACVAAAGTTAPVATATRVKSRASSSFSVQCSNRPKVATAAVFFPPLSLDVILASSGWHSARADRCPDEDGLASWVARRRARGWKSNFCRAAAAPMSKSASTGAGIGVDNDGPLYRRRRRWSFATNARFGGGRAGTTSKARKQRAGMARTPWKSKGLVCSLSPPPVRLKTRAMNSCRSPGALSAARPALGGPNDRSHWEAAPQPETAESAPRKTQEQENNVEANRRRRCTGVRGIVSADYSGEVKVFLGFAVP